MSVILQMLEQVPEAERIFWAERISVENKRSVAVLRVRELRILDAVSGDAGGEYAPTSDEVSEWSDWLQRRASEGSSSLKVLERLSQFGRTRRVKHLSAERLRGLRQAS
ncbi:hypothetical protein OG762_33660 [Streptomyces sp. NBC_01136]|uniref:hypothetical protein n=1 Tax=unclassified Streptomyces TaxID=2593676 RepID=UPI0032442D2F|nr:hypothetical protein OG762_33660 [Streptomyces sp. NBC_01136]